MTTFRRRIRDIASRALGRGVVESGRGRLPRPGIDFDVMDVDGWAGHDDSAVPHWVRDERNVRRHTQWMTIEQAREVFDDETSTMRHLTECMVEDRSDCESCRAIGAQSWARRSEYAAAQRMLAQHDPQLVRATETEYAAALARNTEARWDRRENEITRHTESMTSMQAREILAQQAYAEMRCQVNNALEYLYPDAARLEAARRVAAAEDPDTAAAADIAYREARRARSSIDSPDDPYWDLGRRDAAKQVGAGTDTADEPVRLPWLSARERDATPGPDNAAETDNTPRRAEASTTAHPARVAAQAIGTGPPLPGGTRAPDASPVPVAATVYSPTVNSPTANRARLGRTR